MADLNFQQGNKVWIDGSPDKSGVIMGFGTSNGQPIAIVQLDEPEYTESGKYFISVVVTHVQNLFLLGQTTGADWYNPYGTKV